MRHLSSILSISALLLASLHARETEVVDGHDVVARQAILKLDSSRTNQPLPAILQQLSSLASADDLRPLDSSGAYVIHSRIANVTALLAVLKNHPAVTLAEPDYMVKAVATPNDPSFGSQWDMFNAASPGADIGATLAWNVSTGSTANVLGIVDTGIDYNHPDLAPNVWSAPYGFTVTLSWGQLSCPAGSHGYNAVARTCNPADDHYHGTHVSGTVGAAGNNGQGVSGVNWTASVMGLKFMDSTGNGSVSDAIDAIEFGLQTKAIFGSGANLRVLSNSWGGSGYSQALLNEINKANAADVLFVVAAGNSSANVDSSPTYPASYTAANLISVAATTNTDGLASFSNYGPTKVHLGAPGTNILSTMPGGAYGYLSGTSMATPHVAGAALLVLSRCALNTAGVRNALLANVDVIGALQGITVTGGRLNVNRAIRSCSPGGVPTGGAAYLRTDTATAGSWKSAYGADGFAVINDSASYPGYVSVAPSANGSYTWAGSTADPRAPQKGFAADRIAACWVSNSAFNIDFNFSDGNSHQVALYMLDWDNYGGGRSQRVEIVDGNGTVLDTRNVSGFTGGQYLVWNLSGRVTARITNTNPAGNAVVNALFFGGAPVNTPGAAVFLRADTTTAGSWRGVYGADGYQVVNDLAAYPAYVSVTPANNYSWTWAGSTTDGRATQKASSGDRIAACWVNNSSFSIDLNFTDGGTHQFALYLLDWDGYNGGRTERVDILDANGNVIDSRAAYGFTNGLYFVWNLSGHVSVRIVNNNGASNAVVSGLFFR